MLHGRWDWLEATTGPVMLYNAVQAYKKVNDMTGLTLLPPGVIYPIDWRRTVWGPKDGPGAPSHRPLPIICTCCWNCTGCS